MPENRDELNKKRGNRLRELITERKVTQCKLSEMIGCTEQHVSYIINGRRTLTESNAETIVKLFPPTRLEWLMGRDDFKTPIIAKIHPVVKNLLDGRKEGDCFQLLAFLSGYEFVQYSEPEDSCVKSGDIDSLSDDEITDAFDKALSRVKSEDFYEIHKDGVVIAHCSMDTLKGLEKETRDFVDFIIQKCVSRQSKEV